MRRCDAQVLRKLGHGGVAGHVELQERNLGLSLGAGTNSLNGGPASLFAPGCRDDGEAVGCEARRYLEADALVGPRDDADGASGGPERGGGVFEEEERRRHFLWEVEVEKRKKERGIEKRKLS